MRNWCDHIDGWSRAMLQCGGLHDDSHQFYIIIQLQHQFFQLIIKLNDHRETVFEVGDLLSKVFETSVAYCNKFSDLWQNFYHMKYGDLYVSKCYKNCPFSPKRMSLFIIAFCGLIYEAFWALTINVIISIFVSAHNSITWGQDYMLDIVLRKIM